MIVSSVHIAFNEMHGFESLPCGYNYLGRISKRGGDKMSWRSFDTKEYLWGCAQASAIWFAECRKVMVN